MAKDKEKYIMKTVEHNDGLKEQLDRKMMMAGLKKSHEVKEVFEIDLSTLFLLEKIDNEEISSFEFNKPAEDVTDKDLDIIVTSIN